MINDDGIIAEPDTPQKEMDLNFHTDIPVGEILRRTRVHYGKSLPEVEGVLRIRASQLDALERGDIAQLPGRVYAIGFVRSYSEYLGLDGDKMVHLFKDQSVGRKAKPDLSFSVPATESKTPGLPIVLGGIAGVIVLIILVAVFFLPERTENAVPPVPEDMSRSELNQAPALIGNAGPVQAASQTQGQGATVPQPAAQAPAQPAEPAVPTNRIVIEITDPSWIEIKDAGGKVLLQRVLKTGDVYLVPDEAGITMATGNAGGLKIKIDGREAERLGEIGQIKRNIRLTPTAFGAPATRPATTTPSVQ